MYTHTHIYIPMYINIRSQSILTAGYSPSRCCAAAPAAGDFSPAAGVSPPPRAHRASPAPPDAPAGGPVAGDPAPGGGGTRYPCWGPC